MPGEPGSPTSARKFSRLQQNVTFGGNQIHWFAFAVVGDQANFNGCMVGPVGFRFKLQLGRGNREIHRVAGERTFQVRITSNAGCVRRGCGSEGCSRSL